MDKAKIEIKVWLTSRKRDSPQKVQNISYKYQILEQMYMFNIFILGQTCTKCILITDVHYTTRISTIQMEDIILWRLIRTKYSNKQNHTLAYREVLHVTLPILTTNRYLQPQIRHWNCQSKIHAISSQSSIRCAKSFYIETSSNRTVMLLIDITFLFISLCTCLDHKLAQLQSEQYF